MSSTVVIDLDWFLINGKIFPKVIAFYHEGQIFETEVKLPAEAACYGSLLEKQARHSHGLDWRTLCNAIHIEKAIESFCKVLKIGEEKLIYTKGLQKVKYLEKFFEKVINLEDLGCPRFDVLSSEKQTTFRKAEAFGKWLDHYESPTSWPQPSLDVNSTSDT